MGNATIKFTLSAWYPESETYYSFGPFTEAERAAFIEAHPEREWFTTILNSPNLYGTGNELA